MNDDGRFNLFPEGGRHGLYEVRDRPDLLYKHLGSTWVSFNWLYLDDNIAQIVGAGPQFAPIQIIGVDQISNKIYGYYHPNFFPCTRKRTEWGYALNGSLVAEPVEDGGYGSFSGISRYPGGSLFNLYGSFTNFNYARYNYMDVVRPAIIGDWSGSRARSRGMGNVMNNDGTAKGIAKLCT